MVLVAACSSSKSGSPGVDAPGMGSGSGSWTTLISRTWNLNPGDQNYQCTRIQLTQDYWISGFHAVEPVGTHHAVVAIDPNTTSTGDFNCNTGTGTTGLGDQMIYAAGVGTDDLIFPTGVATHLAAGTWLTLNLHLFDQQDNPLSGESGLQVQTVDASTVVNEVDMTFSGTFTINIPSDGQDHTASGGCTAPTDYHVFALWPHEHQLGKHQTFTVTHAGTATNYIDDAYSFNEQKNYPQNDLVIHSGDTINTTCTYNNTTGSPVGFCETTQCEMCFTGIYKYPAGGTLYDCTST